MSAPVLRTPAYVLACATVIVMISYGVRQSFGLFTDVIGADLGWGRESYSVAIAVQNLMLGLCAPLMGALSDRYWGPTRVLMLAGLLYAAGIFLMSQATTPGEMLGGAGVVAGIGLAGVGLPLLLSIVGRVAPEQRRTMWLAIVTAGATAGQLALVPASQVLIDSLGWVAALVVLAAGAAMIAPLAASLGRNAAAAGDQAGPSLAQALREARGHGGFVLLVLGFFVCGLQVQFVATHLPAYVKDAGGGGYLAASAIAVIGLFNMAGTWGAGWLGDRYRKKYLLSYVYLARSLVVLGFIHLPVGEVSVLAFSALIGLLWLGTVPLTSGVVIQMFGTRYLATLYGVVYLGHQLGSFVGVWLGGRIYDATGAYDLFWWVAIVMGLLAALLHWPIDDRPLARLATQD